MPKNGPFIPLSAWPTFLDAKLDAKHCVIQAPGILGQESGRF